MPRGMVARTADVALMFEADDETGATVVSGFGELPDAVVDVLSAASHA